jgi:hypothetical protein
MAKIFNSGIGFYQLGPMGSPPPNGDKKNWNAVKNMIFSLKDSFYHAYISKFKATSSLSYSTSSDPYDELEGCGGEQYCKGNVTSTNSIQWKVATATDYKISTCQDANPKCNTKEATTLELMYYVGNLWRSKIESKYRVTTARGNCPTGPEISNCKTKMRNCCQDMRMDFDGEKWVRTTLSANPDTTFNDHTYKVDSYISVNISSSGSSGGQFLDDSNYKVQGMGSFGGSYLYLEFESDYNPTTCEKFTGKGTLSFVGKIPASFLQGKPCGTKGQAFLSISWSPSSNAALMPS